MKRLMLVCMAVVIMLGYAGVSSAQDKPVPPVIHHQNIETAPPGVFTPSEKPVTGAGTTYQGPSQMSGSEGMAKSPIPTEVGKPGFPAVIQHHQQFEVTPQGAIKYDSAPPTGAGVTYQGPSQMSGSEGMAKPPIQLSK